MPLPAEQPAIKPQPAVKPPPPIVAVAGWVIPGAGYWLMGERVRGVTIGVTIVLLFVVGCLIGTVRVVDVPTFDQGSLLAGIGQKPWFVGQVFAGPLSLAAALWSHSLGAADSPYRDLVSHARVWEIGTLYTAVAGMLNLLAIIDSSSRAAQGNS